MGLYNVFSSTLEIRYKSCLFSKATLFTLCIIILNLVLPFIIAYGSRGFWLKNYFYFEQPNIRFKYEYLLIAQTNDLLPISCGNIPSNIKNYVHNDEHCNYFKVEERDEDDDEKVDSYEINVKFYIPPEQHIINTMLILSLDVLFETECPLQMQTLAVITKEFSHPASGYYYHGNLKILQTEALPCLRNHIDVKYNCSLLENFQRTSSAQNMLDEFLDKYYQRKVITELKKLHSRSIFGSTSEFEMKIVINIPEQLMRYKPNIWQELKWAWHQYLSIGVIFYWLFKKLKEFVFENRIVMAWKIIPCVKTN